MFSHVFLLKPIGREVKNRTSAMTSWGKVGWYRYEKPQKSKKNLNDIGKLKENCFFLFSLFFLCFHITTYRPGGKK